MNVIHICTFPAWGAGRAARRLHEGLLAAGHYSRIFVMTPQLGAGDEITLCQPSGRLAVFQLRLRRLGLFASRRIAVRRWSRVPQFSDDRSPVWREFLSQIPAADIYHLHWVAGLMDYRHALPGLARRAPLVWTVHDMNPFTGGCHLDQGCGRHSTHCGLCPRLGSSRTRDYSHTVWKRKRMAFEAVSPARIRIIAPSRWSAAEVQRSSLLGHFQTIVIPNCVDASVFAPIERRTARRILDIPEEKNALAFVAADLQDPNKGLSTLLAAVGQVRSTSRLHILSAGQLDRPVTSNVPWTHFGSLASDRLLALVYSAADVFVIPSRQEALPNTLLESLSCGVPAIGSDVGGIPDVIEPGINGLLVPSGDPGALANAIDELFADRRLLDRMGQEGRRVVEERYLRETQTERCLEVYRELLSLAREATSDRVGRRRD